LFSANHWALYKLQYFLARICIFSFFIFVMLYSFALHMRKTMIKKILSALAISLLCFSCTKRKTLSPFREWMQDNGKIKVLSTIAQIGDLAAAIGGDKVDCLVLVPKELDPHSL